MIDIGIYQYLKKYLYWIRNVKYIDCQKYLDTRKQCIDKLITYYAHKNPGNVVIKEGNVFIMQGGSTENYENLNKIYNVIKSIDPDKFQGMGTSIAELDKVIETLRQKITDTAKMENVIDSTGVVQNTIDMIKVGIKKFENVSNISIAQKEINIPNQVKPEYDEIDVNKIINEMKDKLIILEKDKDDVEKFRNGLIPINETVQTMKKDYTEKIQKVIDAYNYMIDKICELDSSTIYKTNNFDKLVFVPDLFGNNSFLQELIDINDNELKKYVIDFKNKVYDTKTDKLAMNVKETIALFSNGISPQEKTNKMIMNMKDAVELFNNGISPYIKIIREKTKYKNFLKYYDGENNIRINNKFFSKTGIVDMQMINDLVVVPELSLSNIQRDILTFPIDKLKQTALIQKEIPQKIVITKAISKVIPTIENIKQPLNAIKQGSIKEQKSISSVVSKTSQTKNIIKQKGGIENNIPNISNELKQIDELTQLLNNYNLEVIKYNKIIIRFNSVLLDHFMHNVFLVMIMTNQFILPGFVIHEYMQRGSIALYRRIINNIFKDLENDPMKTHCIYMRKYHNITLRKLKSFLNTLADKLNDDKMKNGKERVIDINDCDGDNRINFQLLNYFKEILMQYNALAGSKVTIYARINDMAKKITGCEMTYASSFDLPKEETQQIEIKEKIDELVKCPIKDQEKIFQSSIDVRKLWINKDTCNCKNICMSKSGSKTKKDNFQEELIFTEVFDSTQYPTSAEISKYMQIETLLSQGRGVGIMTYGYSGTGKSFSLFGSSKDNISGILQSTLGDVNGLHAVHFRSFELYGYGMPYPHYWAKTDIVHNIYHYNTVADPEKGLLLRSEPEYQIKQSNFSAYINNTEKDTKGKKKSYYITIQENMISKTFKEFENYIKLIDNRRELTKRIRDTPNNPVSSRSVIVYDFQLEVQGQDKMIPFLIIDLPGREELLESFVESYIDDSNIKNILQNYPPYKNQTKSFEELKIVLAFSVINPLGLAMVESDIILDIIAKTPKDKRDKLFEAIQMELPTNAKDEQILASYKDKFRIKAQNISKNLSKTTVDAYTKLYYRYPPQTAYTQEKLKITDLTELTPVKNTNSPWMISGKYRLLDEFVNMDCDPLGAWFSYDDINGTFKFEAKPSATDGYSTDTQYQIVLCMHIINRLILNNDFETLFKIITEICEKRINKHINTHIDSFDKDGLMKLAKELLDTKFKRLYWTSNNIRNKQIQEDEISLQQIITKNSLTTNDIPEFKEGLKSIMCYDYIKTPYEGFYINENIIGLIKYLASVAKQDDPNKDKFINEQIPRQNETLDFTFQRNKLRIMEMTGQQTDDAIRQKFNFSAEIPQKLFTLSSSKQLVMNTDNIDKIYNEMKESYKSEKIFNFEHPIIENILKPYLAQIYDYKVLYTLANYQEDNIRCNRCDHQYKLLDKTRGFIQTIAPN